jgi:uncharacterized protein with FMN-binding domain
MTITRAPIVLGATALGLAATLGFNTHHAGATATAAGAATPATTTTSTSSSSKRRTSTSSSSSSSSSSSKATTSTSATKTATGDAIGTQYGNVQLKVTVANGKITRIEALQLPSNDPKSQQIGAYAEPLLTQSALSKQDGTVDAVSGATYTSNGYAAALQSALDKAGFRAATSSSSAAA